VVGNIVFLKLTQTLQQLFHRADQNQGKTSGPAQTTACTHTYCYLISMVLARQRFTY
jgi:hypothetical protein